MTFSVFPEQSKAQFNIDYNAPKYVSLYFKQNDFVVNLKTFVFCVVVSSPLPLFIRSSLGTSICTNI